MPRILSARASRKASDRPLSCSEQNAEKADACIRMAEEAIATNHPSTARLLLDAATSSLKVVRSAALRRLFRAEIDRLAKDVAITADAPPLTAARWAERALTIADEALAAGQVDRAKTALRAATRIVRCVPSVRRAALLRQSLRLAVWLAEIETERRAA